MNKIGLALVYRLPNFGTALQAYATQKFVEKERLNFECINYQKCKSLKTFFSYLPELTIPYVVEMKLQSIKKRIEQKIRYRNLAQKFAIRNSVFAGFISNYMKLSEPIRGYAALLEKGREAYCAVVVGSDQVWHPLNLGSRFYTLEWVPDNIPKIAYASSFGVSKIPDIQRNATVRYLKRLDFVSTREIAGQKIIKELAGKEVPVVVDPTLLHSIDEWNVICSHKPFVGEKYIFCYFLGNNPGQREFAKRLRAKTGFKIVFLPHMDEIIKSDFNFGDITPYDVGPAEFFNLIKHAEYVCTDSFHGTIFSILNKKKFASFNRYHGGAISTNSRLDSLLNMLGLESQRFTADHNVNNLIESKIDYDFVNVRLEKLRDTSVTYFRAALQVCEVPQ